MSGNSSPTLYQQYGPASSILTVYNQEGANITSQIGDSGEGWRAPGGPDRRLGRRGNDGRGVGARHRAGRPHRPDRMRWHGRFDGLFTGAATAAELPGVTVVSMSWIWFEDNWSRSDGSGELAYDSSTFVTPERPPRGDLSGKLRRWRDPRRLSGLLTQCGGGRRDAAHHERRRVMAARPPGASRPRARSITAAAPIPRPAPGRRIREASAAPTARRRRRVTASATWTTSISSSDQGWLGGTEVSATWVGRPANATNATYRSTTAQRRRHLAGNGDCQSNARHPSAPATATRSSRSWAIFYPTSGTLTVVLIRDSANGTVVADAVGIAPAGPPPAARASTSQSPGTSFRSRVQANGRFPTSLRRQRQQRRDVLSERQCVLRLLRDQSFQPLLGGTDRHRRPGTCGRRRQRLQ